MISEKNTILIISAYNIIVSSWIFYLIVSIHEEKAKKDSNELKFPFMDNESGFSLAEVMVASGMLGLLSLGTMHLLQLQNDSTSKLEAKIEEVDFQRNVLSLLVEKGACQKTFSGSSIGSNISDIKNSAGNAVYSVGKTYGNRKLTLTSLKTIDKGIVGTDGLREVDLVMGLDKIASGKKTSKNIKVGLRVKAAGPTDPIIECFSDTDAIINTAKEESCLSLGGVWDGEDGSCDLQNYVKRTGDSMDGTLNVPSLTSFGIVNAGSVSSTGAASASSFCIGAYCRTTFAKQGCSIGSVVKSVNADGTVVCSNVTCPDSTTFFVGVDSSGSPICKPFPTNTCGVNEYVSKVNNDGSVVCSPLPPNSAVSCAVGTVIQSIAADGTPSCLATSSDTNVFDKKCASGKYLEGFDASGSPICQALSSSSPSLSGQCILVKTGSIFGSCPAGMTSTFGSNLKARIVFENNNGNNNQLAWFSLCCY